MLVKNHHSFSMTTFLSGGYVPAISLSGERYEAFQPTLLRTNVEWKDSQTYHLLEAARGYLGELNAYAKLVPDIDYFIASHVAKEAEQSSRIEGTSTTLEEVYLDEDDMPDQEKVHDRQEVLNYIKATNWAVEQIVTPNRPPLSLRLVCDTHKLLLAGVRGHRKHPGVIRTSQNKIGGSREHLTDAVFIPPAPREVPALLDDLERFWHNQDTSMPNLLKVAYAHYQFETIHPFDDGNGRIGRLIIVLQMISYGMLDKPVLYLSEYFEKHRGAYYDALMRVRASNDLEHWVKFFLVGVRDTAHKARTTLEAIIDLRSAYDQRLMHALSQRRYKQAKTLLEYLYKKPVTTAQEVEKILSVTKPTAHALVNALVDARILKERTNMPRNRVYVLHEYLDLFNR